MDTELSEPLLREAGHRGEYLLPRDFVALAERYLSGPDREPGVSRARVAAHLEPLGEESHVEAEPFGAAIDDATVDSDHWAGDQAVYEVGDDRLSAYPPSWHEAIGGSTSLPEMVRYLMDETAFQPVDGGAGDGIPESDLIDIAAVVGGFTLEEARAELEACRDDGRLVEDADQNPNAGVYLPRSDQESDVKGPDE